MKKVKGWICAAAVLALVSVGSSVVSINENSHELQGIEELQHTETGMQNGVEEKPNDESFGKTVEPIETENNSGEMKEKEKETNASLMEVHFIDVGQGDATLIKADGKYMLIDAGNNDMGTKVQLYLQKQGVEKLDYLILTQTDADHIGGADVIVTKFDIDVTFMGDYKKDTKTYEELINAFKDRGLVYSIPEVGSEYKLGNATFTILAPNRTYEDPNNSSIALLLKNGNNTFLFTGDCEEEAEKDILANGLPIDCDVYKLGHHGSKTSSSKAFLEAITPVYGVISCEMGNSYGHPHAQPLNSLRSMGTQIFRTDEQGSIVAYSDGTEITWNCAPSKTWQTGVATDSASNPVAMEENGDTTSTQTQQGTYVVGNKNTKVFHRPDCTHLPKEKNQMIFDSREDAMAAGYDNPCDYCKP